MESYSRFLSDKYCNGGPVNVLAVVAHPDDEIFGCGATLKKLADAGHSVYTCVLCASADARFQRPSVNRLAEVSATAEEILGVSESMTFDFPNIRFNTVPHLEVVAAVETAIIAFKPAWIFTHHGQDVNIDHRVVFEATMAAARLPQRFSTDLSPHLIKRIFLCEIPSATDWALPSREPFIANSYFDVSAALHEKLAALKAFEGALKPHPHPRSLEAVEYLARLRGAQVGTEAAEAFMIVRDLNLFDGDISA